MQTIHATARSSAPPETVCRRPRFPSGIPIRGYRAELTLADTAERLARAAERARS